MYNKLIIKYMNKKIIGSKTTILGKQAILWNELIDEICKDLIKLEKNGEKNGI